MSNEIFQSLVQLYGDVYGDEITAPHINSMVSSSRSSETSVWTFSSINRYQNHIGACTVTVYYDSLFYYVDMVQIEYDNELVCVWFAPEDPTADYSKKYCDSDVIEDDFNVVMAIARDGFFDSFEELEENLDDDDDDEPDENGMVNIPLNLTDSELGRIARAAHKLDITINEFMNLAVKEVLEEMNYDYENL